MARPAGSLVELRYDWWSTDDPPEPGAYLLTPAGSAYEIREIRPTARAGRYRIRALKLHGADEIPNDAEVASLHWTDRRRRRGR